MDDAAVRGAGVALLRGGRVVWLEGFGVRDQRSGEPVTPQTVFQAASLGKVVAAYGALLRVQDGDWQLSMPVASERLEIAPGCRPPTLVDLLSHRSGLGNDLRAAHLTPECRPPAPFSYSGQGYLVLQELFGDVSGRSAQAFLRERVFEPLGMTSATYAQPRGNDVAIGHADSIYAVLSGTALGAERAWAAALGLAAGVSFALLAAFSWRAHARLRSGAIVALEALAIAALGLGAASLRFVPVAPWDTAIMLPSSLHASAEDLAKFAAELLRPRLLSPALRDQLFAPRGEIDDQLAWGAGIGVDRIPSEGGSVASYWQWGSNPGFQGLLVAVPERGDAIVVLTNTGGFADVLLGHRGGYVMAKRLARRALGLNGRWDLWRDAPSGR